MAIYSKEQRLPNLQELEDVLCKDNEIEYVVTKHNAVAQLDKINIGDNNSIYTKLKKYPYEFEINNELQLASIDGVKIESTGTIEEIQKRVSKLENEITELKEKNSNLETIIEILQKIAI